MDAKNRELHSIKGQYDILCRHMSEAHNDAITYYVFEELPVPYYKLFGKVILRFKEKKCNF